MPPVGKIYIFLELQENTKFVQADTLKQDAKK